MKKYLIAISCLSISAYAIAKERPSIESNFPVCGQSILNEKNITKVCATRDFIALEPRKRKKDWLAFLAAEGSSGYYGPIDPVGAILKLKNQELDLQGHVWDFSNQHNSDLELRTSNMQITNGVILNTNIFLGGGYFSPNFNTKKQIGKSDEKVDFIYAQQYENESIENSFINKVYASPYHIYLRSWGGGILNSKLIITQNINIDGSKSTIQKNQIISQANIDKDKKNFLLIKLNQSFFIDISKQIFPDRWNDKTTIPNILYVKFSPDTVIDGNTFTLTQKNDQAYAIVLDHSPRVRITNNTFNGFKVPILMDQWSSIVDEKGKEIKPENFKGYGNIINPNKFAGNVTMNRKGEIVKE